MVLCAGVMICATIVDQKFDFYMLTPVIPEIGKTGNESVSAPMLDAPAVQI